MAALARDAEGTGATIRAVETVTVVLVGLLAAVAGAELFPDRSAYAAGLLVAFGAAAASLFLSAVGRGLGAAHPEGTALALAVPVRGLRLLLRPLGRVVALFGAGRARFSLPTPPLEEMERRLAEYASAQGRGPATSELIHNVFELTEKVARDVMVPRTEMLAVDLSTPLPEILRLLAEQGHSRVPVYQGQLDQVVGILHARDLVPLLEHPGAHHPARRAPAGPLRPLVQAAGAAAARAAAQEAPHGAGGGRVRRRHGAVHPGGRARADRRGDPRRVRRRRGSSPWWRSRTAPSAWRAPPSSATSTGPPAADLPEGDGVETVGGFLNGVAGAIPARGDRFFWRGWVFTVSDADPRRVTRVRAAPAARPPAARKA